jgi:hypothetical protein
MDTIIVCVIAALSSWLVKWKKKCTESNKKRRDGRLIKCMNVHRSRFLLINEVFSTVCSGKFKILIVLFRSFSNLTFLNVSIELLSGTLSSQDLSQHLLKNIITNYFHASSTTHFSTRDEAASSSDILNVSLHSVTVKKTVG